MKKNIIILNLVFFLAMTAVFYLLAHMLSEYKAKDLRQLTIEKARSAVNVSIPSINRALQNSDDIALLTNIEAISKLESVSSAFILDKNDTVIIHNNTDEWNSKRTGGIYEKAVNHNGELLQPSFDKDHILFSVPLAKDYTLCCIFSTQKAAETAGYWKIKYFTFAGAAAAVLIIILYLFSKLFIALPFNRTKQKIEKGALDAPKDGKFDEIADMFAAENEKSRQKITALENDKKSLTKIIEHYLSGFQNAQLLIILDSSNNIVYSYDKTGKFLKKEFAPGSNIIEAAVNPAILEAAAKAAKSPEKEINEMIENFSLSALALGETGNIYSTILKI